VFVCMITGVNVGGGAYVITGALVKVGAIVAEGKTNGVLVKVGAIVAVGKMNGVLVTVSGGSVGEISVVRVGNGVRLGARVISIAAAEAAVVVVDSRVAVISGVIEGVYAVAQAIGVPNVGLSGCSSSLLRLRLQLANTIPTNSNIPNPPRHLSVIIHKTPETAAS